MNILTTISIEQLQQAVIIRQQIESLQVKLSDILGNETGNGTHLRFAFKRRGMSAAARARIAAAQRARWAKLKGKGQRKMSAAAKAKISAAARARWKKAKAQGRNRL